MPDLVSVIIPVYNHAGTVVRAVRSIVRGNYRPIEIVIVDDGSEDDLDSAMKTVIKDAGESEIRLKFVRQRNSGAAAARNRGFSESAGSFVIFYDADTIARPEMLDKMINALKNSYAAYAYSGFKFGWKKFHSREFDANALRRNNYIDVTSLIRRGDFPGFDPAIRKFQDWDLWLTMLENNKTGIGLPEILYKKIVGGRAGISRWLPRFVYRLPAKIREVRRFEEARSAVLAKHGLEP